MNAPREVAAVDLGSNSFHMVVARLDDDRPTVVDKLRDRVQLAAGLRPDGRIEKETSERAVACLELFGQRVKGVAQGDVRAVGTYSLRRAHRATGVLDAFQTALGHEIQIISGQEEARLVYLGVVHDIAVGSQERLVVDIGGGSTECILGSGFDVQESQSLHMGCVSFSRRYFPDGKINAERLELARTAARLQLQSLERQYRESGWDVAQGSSGTILAIADILRESGWTRGEITRKGLARLESALLAAGSVRSLDLPGLKRERKSVLPGGVAILGAIFDSLAVTQMQPASGALREGILYDLVGRIQHHDVRDKTIRRLVAKRRVDPAQAQRVRRMALAFFDQCASSWKVGDAESRSLLGWAAQLHEIGLAIARGGYHKHGAYIVRHADMPGFSRNDQALLSALLRNHRRKLNSLDEDGNLPGRELKRRLRLTVLLRLAVRLHRARVPVALDGLTIKAKKSKVHLTFPAGWLDSRPLTRADLGEERDLLAGAGIHLAWDESD